MGSALDRIVRRLQAAFGRQAPGGLLLLALGVGLGTGAGALAFRALVEAATRAVFGAASPLEVAGNLPPLWRFAAPVLGLFVVSEFGRRLAPEVRGHGVPEVMHAVLHEGGRIRPRVVLIKALASALTIGSGGSVGREGPIVQIGSAIGSTVGQRLGLEVERVRLLLACGAAAGISATFNAPIAGVIFAVEIILGAASISTFSPIVVASVSAATLSRWTLGDAPAFTLPAYRLAHPLELVSYMGLGLLAGLLALGFTNLLYFFEDLFDRLPRRAFTAPLLGGVSLGALGLLVPHVYGIGYESIEHVLHHDVALGLLAALVLAKLVATSLTLAGGGSGGIFAPSLFLGAALGGAYGLVLQDLSPWPVADPAAYALVGMGAVVAGTTHAPLTAIIILFELTGGYSIILPLMLTCIVALVVAVAVQGESIYTLKLVRRGERVAHPTASNRVRSTPVRDLMRQTTAVLAPDTPFQEVVDRLLEHDGHHLYVHGPEGRFLGVVRLEEVKPLLRSRPPEGLVNAYDLLSHTCPTVDPNETLESCLVRFSGTSLRELPVVEEGRQVGVIRRDDLLAFLNREILHLDDLGFLFVTHPEEEAEERDYVELPAGHGIEGVVVPPAFVGKTLRELDLRRKRGLLVIGLRVQRDGEVVRLAPDPDAPLEEGTALVVEGPRLQIDWLRRCAKGELDPEVSGRAQRVGEGKAEPPDGARPEGAEAASGRAAEGGGRTP